MFIQGNYDLLKSSCTQPNAALLGIGSMLVGLMLVGFMLLTTAIIIWVLTTLILEQSKERCINSQRS
jgi:hypothetical protein